MGKIEAVILDWAGTAVDYGSFAPVEAFQEVFRQYGLEPTMDETRAPMGTLKIDHIRTMLQMPRLSEGFQKAHGRPFTEQDVQAMHDSFSDKLMGILHQFATPNPHVLETVDALRQKGVKIGSTTGYTDAMMSIVVPEAAKRGYAPDCWFSPDSTCGLGRPYPYMLFKNMENLRISSVGSVIKVGDTVSDIQEGVNAGVWTVGVLEGSSALGLTQEELSGLDSLERQALLFKTDRLYRDHGANFVIQNLSHLPEVIGEIELRAHIKHLA